MSTATHHDGHHHANGPVTVPATDASAVRRLALIAAAVGIGAYLVLGFVNLGMSHHGTQDFFLAYLVGWVFILFLPFGSMSLLMIGYLTTASWQLVLRRSFQAATRTLPVVALLGLPIVVSLFISVPAHDSAGSASATETASPFWWADKTWTSDTAANIAAAKGMPELAVEENQHKIHDYLNPTFFIVRFVLYFALWYTIIHLLNKWGRRAEESDDANAQYNLKAISGPGVVAWGLSGTFAITDWVMSVEPTWASSMFPVVFGMNSFISAICIGVLTFYALNAGKPDVLAIVKDKFRIDIGTLLFGFTMVWAYASFCQYMLIWAGNLPEEITYYRKRGDHGWEVLAYILMAFHWFLPFIVFLFREVKTSPRAMRRMAWLLLTVCALDVVWWIVPALPRPDGGLHAPMALAAVVGLFGVWGLVYAAQLGTRPLLPENRETEFLATWGGH
ncbi:MAG TPA: hypothetical protein VM533_00415 [Fimbriiglobus sp.]|nr:hypothetical protein [Fimbriiglobus sp.]